jgi:hypothetical protein
MMLGGIGAAVVGGVLLVANGSSSVRQGDAPSRTPFWTKPVVPSDTPATLHVALAALSF